MFNYDFGAPEKYLWMDMGTELLPLIERPPQLTGYMAKCVSFLRLVCTFRVFQSCLLRIRINFPLNIKKMISLEDHEH